MPVLPVVNERAERLRQRTRRFAIRIVRFARSLPREPWIQPITNQLVRAGTGLDANYRAACRGRSRPEFIAKLGLAVEEADETETWLNVLGNVDLPPTTELEWLRNESAELRAIMVRSLKTARHNYQTRSRNP